MGDGFSPGNFEVGWVGEDGCDGAVGADADESWVAREGRSPGVL